MKKNLFLRLFLMMVVVLSFHSCRQDILQEPETYHNTSAFQLTSKRISLNEAKHRSKLLPEIEQIENKFKVQGSAFGKIVNYGDGVSIDTDNVTYIENGPNYHTYTFKIQRENAPADAPVENLVLSPLTDGTYRELLITYNFTPQEKQTLMNGGFVDTKGKTTVTELASGTYSGALAKTSCSYETVTIRLPCSSPKYHHLSAADCELTGADAPQSYTMVALVCGADTSLGDDGSPGGGVSIGPTGGLGGGEDDGSGNTDSPSNGPIDCNGGLTAPQTPNYDISDGGCGTGIPTQPNLPLPFTDPCKKTKASITAADNLLQNPTVQTQMDGVLKGKVTATKEWSVAIGQASNGYEVTPAVEQNATNGTVPASQLVNPYIADGHSHAGGFGDPSGGDLYGFLENILTNPGLKYRYVYGNNFGVTETYALVLNDKTLISNFLAQFPRSENYDPDIQTIKEDSPLGIEFYRAHNHSSEGRNENNTGEMYRPAAVAMAYIFEKYNVGVSIAKADTNGNLKKINASVEQIAVPHSSVKEGVKISKCP